jgi:hypothetical protein
MSKVKAARTETSPDEESRAYDLHEEIETKLSQAKGICTLICGAAGGDKAISESASAAEDLIEGVEKALDELRDMGIDHEHSPKAKEVQS